MQRLQLSASFFLCRGICSICHLPGTCRMCDPDSVYRYARSEECHSCDCCGPALQADVQVCVFDESGDAIRHFDDVVFHSGNPLLSVCGEVVFVILL